MKFKHFEHAHDLDHTWDNTMEYFHRKLENTMLRFGNSAVRLGSFLVGLNERIGKLDERLTKLETPSAQQCAQDRPQSLGFPQSLVFYYGRVFLEALGDGNIGLTAIDPELQKSLIAAAKKVRQARGLRNWVLEPETAEDAALRMVADLKHGYSEYGTNAEGIFLHGYVSKDAFINGKWGKPERRSGVDRRKEQANVHFLRRRGRRRKEDAR